MKRAILALADGTVFKGTAFGATAETTGEVVFNTAMSGYQEILTDRSYRGQMVTMTYPHIGNYGINPEDVESRKPWLAGFIVKEACRTPSSWRSRLSLEEYLKSHGIAGIQGIDTRALTTHLRDHGSQQGCISHLELDPLRVVQKAREAPSIIGRDLVQEVTCSTPYGWTESSKEWKVRPEPPQSPLDARFKVVAFDFGIKYNILRRLVDHGCDVTVVPASTTAAAALAMKPDGIFLSNGPGDPEGVPYAVEAVRNLLGKRPVLGICLGHQILGLAYGLQTYKLKFGHHGANHPVLNSETQRVEITSQNHNFAVRGATERSGNAPGAVWPTPYGAVTVSHTSLNDSAVEGLRCLDIPTFSVQYHPEASPGPHDAAYLFQGFLDMMAKGRA